MCRDVPRYAPIAAGYCRAGGGGGQGAFMASVTTRFLRDAAGRIAEVADRSESRAGGAASPCVSRAIPPSLNPKP